MTGGVCSASRPLSAASPVLFPHEVGECHRLWRVSFNDFVCLLVGGVAVLRESLAWGRRCCGVALRRWPVSAASSALFPHEVGECHRLCPVSFSDFLCLLEGGWGEGFDNACLFLTSCVIWREVGTKARTSRVIQRLRVSFGGRRRRKVLVQVLTRARGSARSRARGVA